MSIRVVDRKLLWGRAANRCSWEGCNQRLSLDLHDPESAVLSSAGAIIGEEAHLRSAREGGPRYEANYPVEKLNSYENLILMCPTHHTVIDKDGGEGFSVERLVEIKMSHETRVDSRLDANQRIRQEIDERLLASLTIWEQMVRLPNWKDVSAGLNMPIPVIREDDLDSLNNAAEWLLAKVWPESYPRTRIAFELNSRILRALVSHINTSFIAERGSSLLELRQEYKQIERWDPPLYDRLLREFYVEAAAVWWLVVEMTRSLNFVIATIREEVEPYYRFDEGYVLMQDGDGIIESRRTLVQYESTKESNPTFLGFDEGIRLLRELYFDIETHPSTVSPPIFGMQVKFCSIEGDQSPSEA